MPDISTPPEMVVAPERGGIEILVQMAERGEIDPKNIDILDVTDRFLKAIAAAPAENLRQSGKIIFHKEIYEKLANKVLRMKAEALLSVQFEDLGGGDDFLEFGEDGSPIIYDSHHQAVGRQITLADLERAIVRQTKIRQLRHRRVTLEQLIAALREAEMMEGKRKERQLKTHIDLDGYSDMRELDDRRTAILSSIEEQGKLTDGLKQQLMEADTKSRLEDLYLPYKPKRRTKAQIAREAGLEPLATGLLANPMLDPRVEAEKFVDKDKGIELVVDAQGRYRVNERTLANNQLETLKAALREAAGLNGDAK